MKIQTLRLVGDCVVTIMPGTVLEVIEKRAGTVPWRPYWVADYGGYWVAVFDDEAREVEDDGRGRA